MTVRKIVVATVALFLVVFLFGGLNVSADSGTVAESTTARLIPEDSIDRVIVVVIDSMNSDYIFNNHHNRDFFLTPNIGELVKNGVAFANATSALPAMTQTSHLTIVSGAYTETFGIPGNVVIENPLGGYSGITVIQPWEHPEMITGDTIFKAMERENPEYTSAVVAGKNYVGVPIWADYQVAPSRLSDSVKDELPNIYTFPEKMYSDSTDSVVMDFVLEVLGKKDPDVMLVNLPWVDEVQHNYGFGSGESLAAVHWADHQVGRLIQYLEESGKLDRTLIVLTADHGQSNVFKPFDFHAFLAERGIDSMVIPELTSGHVFLRDQGDMDRAVAALWETGVVDGVWGGDDRNKIHIVTPYTGDIYFSVRPPYYNAIPKAMAPFFVFGPDGQKGTHAGLSETSVPLVFFGPKVDRGVLHQGGACLTDIVPTIVDLTGLPLPNDSQGTVLSVRNDLYTEAPQIPYSLEETKAQRVGYFPVFLFVIGLGLLVALVLTMGFRFLPFKGIKGSALAFLEMPLRTRLALALLSLLSVFLTVVSTTFLDVQTIYSDVPGIPPDSLIAERLSDYAHIPGGQVTISFHFVFLYFLAGILLGSLISALVSKYLLKVGFTSTLVTFPIFVIPMAAIGAIYFIIAAFVAIPLTSITCVSNSFLWAGLGLSLLFGTVALRKMSGKTWWRVAIPIAIFGFIVGYYSLYTILMGIFGGHPQWTF
jgi:hypothetical protein